MGERKRDKGRNLIQREREREGGREDNKNE